MTFGSSPIAHTQAVSTDGITAVTLGIDTTGADLIVLNVAYYQGNPAPTVSDSKSNTWIPLTPHAAINNALQIFHYCQGGSVGAGHTFTVSSGLVTFPSLNVQAWVGSSVSPFDQENGTGSASAASLATGSITPSQDGCLIVTGASFDSSFGTSAISPPTGYTMSDANSGTMLAAFASAMAYVVQTTASATNPNWVGNVGSGGVGVGVVSFKAAGGDVLWAQACM